MLSTAVANTEVVCASNEYVSFQPLAGSTCGEYMADYIMGAGGYLMDPNATADCSFCSIADTNVFLAGVKSSYSDRWRNFGILWVYIIFNIFGALFLYWLTRVPKKAKKTETTKSEQIAPGAQSSAEKAPVASAGSSTARS